MRPTLALSAVLLATSAALAAEPPKAETKDIGFAVGPFLPVGGIADAYDIGLYATLRGYYFPASSRHGVRAALWAAWADGSTGIDDGYGYGGEMNYAAHFGGGEAPFYLFLGAGFCGTDFIAVDANFPGTSTVHIRGSAYTVNAGVGYVWRKMFVEASYVEVFDDQKNFGVLPVTVGLRF